MSMYQPPAALPVTTTGGWARPGWRDIVEEAPERFGPADREELFDDYATLAITDQERCGLDILTDGEHRRLGWIEAMTAGLPGIRRREPSRRLGAVGYDMLWIYELLEPLDYLESLWDFVTEYEFLAARTDRRPRVGIPGPYGMTTELDFTSVYPSRRACA
jgi:5-methyltetrahydropteroyltriglutamate--homocysteine methyltransferase